MAFIVNETFYQKKKVAKDNPIYFESDVINRSQIFNYKQAVEFLCSINCQDCKIKRISGLTKERILKFPYTMSKTTEIVFPNRIDLYNILDNINFLSIHFTDNCSQFAIQMRWGGYLKLTPVLFSHPDNPNKKNSRFPKGYLFFPEIPKPQIFNPFNPRGYPDNIIIRAITQYLYHKLLTIPIEQEILVFFFGISPTTYYRNIIEKANNAHKKKRFNNLSEIFEKIGGYAHIIINGNGNLKFKNDKVQGFIWIPDSTFEILKKDLSKKCCIELDTSFKGTKPNVYVVVQLIYRNVGIPIALIVGPKENQYLYSLFYEAFKIYDQKMQNDMFYYKKIKSIPILTDMHSSFSLLAEHYELQHYYCYAHIIRSYGANSVISILVRNILFSHTEEEFIENKDRYSDIFEILLSLNSKTAKGCSKRFTEDILLVNETHLSQDYGDQRFSPLYHRMRKNIPTTTNHSERFHCTVNQSIKDLHITDTSIYDRIAIIIQCMKDSIKTVNERLYRQIRDRITQLINRANKSINPKANLDDYDKTIAHKRKFFQKRHCDMKFCYEKEYNNYKFGPNIIPCIHCVLHPYYTNKKALKDFIDQIETFYYEKDDKATEIIFINDYQLDYAKEHEEKGKGIVSFIPMNPFDECDFDHPITAMLVRIYFGLKATKLRNKINIFDLVDLCLKSFAEILKTETDYLQCQNKTDKFINRLTAVVLFKVFEKYNDLKDF